MNKNTKLYLRHPDPIRHSQTSSFTLSREMKRKWVAALRSGKYKQGKHLLYRLNSDSFCCLGVLCHLLGAPKEKLANKGMPVEIGIFSNVDWVVNGYDLADLNDNGYSFANIAARIEKYVPTHD